MPASVNEIALTDLPAPLSRLKQFAAMRPVANKRCELCGGAIAADHAHLVEPEARRLVCCCQACAVLFSNQDRGRYRRVTRDVERLNNFQLSDFQWENLAIPIDLAFFFKSTPAGRIVAVYPSPVGATESQPAAEAWQELVEANPVLDTLEPDAEALLVNRTEGARDYYRVPIDRCYHLTGLIRTHWRGVSGGPQVREEIARFFTHLEEQAQTND